jgi:hypothetical protein
MVSCERRRPVVEVHESVHATSLGYPPPPTVTGFPTSGAGDGEGDDGGPPTASVAEPCEPDESVSV